MNMLKPALALAFLLGALASPDAWAQGRGHGGGHGHGHGYHHRHGHVRGAFIVGAPVYWPRYGYFDPYYDRYYYPPGYYAGAPLYLPPAEAPSLPSGLYYCVRPRGYFPNVGACLVPWRVLTATVVLPP